MARQSLFIVVRVRGAAWQADRPMHEQTAWSERAAFMDSLAARRFVVVDRDASNHPVER